MPYKEKDGSWRAVKMIHGKRHTKRFRTQAKAKKWEAEQSAALWVEQAKPTVTVYSLAEAYLDHAQTRYTVKTYLEKKLAFKHLLQFVDPDTPADAVPPHQIHAALAHRARASGNAANKDRKNLRAAWAWADEVLGLRCENPFSRIKRFKHDERPRYVPPEADFWAAYNAAAAEDRVFLLTALHTAARKGELFRLLWSDVDPERGKIRLGTRKTAHGGLEYAWLPMTSDLKHALARHRITAMRGLHVFTQPGTSEPFTNRQHYMERLCRRAKVRTFGFHAIRHLSASILAQAGVDIPTIQAILRHKSPTTTARYLRRLGVVENVLEEVFSKTKAPGMVCAEDLERLD